MVLIIYPGQEAGNFSSDFGSLPQTTFPFTFTQGTNEVIWPAPSLTINGAWLNNLPPEIVNISGPNVNPPQYSSTITNTLDFKLKLWPPNANIFTEGETYIFTSTGDVTMATTWVLMHYLDRVG